MVKNKLMHDKNLKQFLLGIVILVVINIISSYVWYRFDLTSDKRYTLSRATRQMLKNMDDKITFKVYLGGSLPSGFQRLRNESAEMLKQFKAYSGHVAFEFIEPVEKPTDKKDKISYKELFDMGISPLDLQVKNSDGLTRKLAFPAAVIEYKGHKVVVDLFKNRIGLSPEEVLNNSVQGLEYSFVNGMRKLTIDKKQKIAFLHGHGELEPIYTYSAERILSEYYDVEHVKISAHPNRVFVPAYDQPDSVNRNLNYYAAIIVAKPDSAFDKKEYEKYVLDQFVMRGGKMLWLVEPVKTALDSLRKTGQTVGVAQDLNLDDMFFNYGVRLNSDLVVDLNALPIPVVVDQRGTQDLLPWLYYPLLQPSNAHAVTKNLNAIKSEYVSSIDTVETPNVKKTVLLSTSQYSRKIQAPAMIKLAYLYQKADPNLLNQPHQPIAILLEGAFNSLFFNRMPPVNNLAGQSFVPKSSENAMIVISDGDIIKNQLQDDNGKPYPLPLGKDKYTGEQFGNDDFILNAVNYLCGDKGLLDIRTREVKLYMLDKAKVEKNRTFVQLLNIILPLCIIVLFAWLYLYNRKRKYNR